MSQIRHIDRIIAGPRTPNVSFHPRLKRGTRAMEMTVSGRDMYGKPMGERITIFIHWRKFKRLVRKMGME